MQHFASTPMVILSTVTRASARQLHIGFSSIRTTSFHTATRLYSSSSLPVISISASACIIARTSPFTGNLMPAQQSRAASSSAGKKRDGPAPARPSSSVVLLSPTNDVLLLHRVQTSSSFASAHVFPGGNVDTFHDGEVPAEGNPDRHRDSLVYRMCAIRETFEETGILLAKKEGKLLELPENEREEARKLVHNGKVKFGDWLKSVGGEPDTAGLLPFTRWITPLPVPKRFTTQMYLYMLPLTRSGNVPSKMLIPKADGGIEHTAALFGPPEQFLKQALDNSIILFPPQVYLLDIISKFTGGEMGSLEEESRRFMVQRRKLVNFLKKVPTASTEKGKQHQTASISWAEKVISPIHLLIRNSDQRVVLGLDKPGLELEGSDRAGDWERVALVKFAKGGPSQVEIRLREDVLKEERETEEAQAKL